MHKGKTGAQSTQIGASINHELQLPEAHQLHAGFFHSGADLGAGEGLQLAGAAFLSKPEHGVDYLVEIRRREGHHLDACVQNYVGHKLAEHGRLSLSYEQQADGMKREVRDEAIVFAGGCEQSFGLLSLGLIEKYFEEDVRVDEQAHGCQTRQRLIWC